MGAAFHNHNHRTYGFSHTRIDNIYKGMISRCYHPANNRYARYGGCGITVCDEWLEDKTKFFDWAFRNGYQDDLTIDRIDNNGNYSPNNCRWVSQKVQQNHRSNNRKLTCRGESHTLGEWSSISGVKLSTIWARLNKGWNTEEAIFRKVT